LGPADRGDSQGLKKRRTGTRVTVRGGKTTSEKVEGESARTDTVQKRGKTEIKTSEQESRTRSGIMGGSAILKGEKKGKLRKVTGNAKATKASELAARGRNMKDESFL